MIAFALVFFGHLAGAAGIPHDVEALAKRADACAAVWSSKAVATNAKFTSIEIQEKNEEILTTNKCNTLSANVISTCLKYDQDPHLKKICAHLLLQTADTGAPPPPEATMPPPAYQKALTPLPPPTYTKPATLPLPARPASGLAPPTASGAAMMAPPPPVTGVVPEIAMPAAPSTEIPPPPTEQLPPAPPMREPAGPAANSQ